MLSEATCQNIYRSSRNCAKNCSKPRVFRSESPVCFPVFCIFCLLEANCRLQTFSKDSTHLFSHFIFLSIHYVVFFMLCFNMFLFCFLSRQGPVVSKAKLLKHRSKKPREPFSPLDCKDMRTQHSKDLQSVFDSVTSCSLFESKTTDVALVCTFLQPLKKRVLTPFCNCGCKGSQ